MYPNGDEYEGEYQEGKRHGQGTYKWIKTVRDPKLGAASLAEPDPSEP